MEERKVGQTGRVGSWNIESGLNKWLKMGSIDFKLPHLEYTLLYEYSYTLLVLYSICTF